MLTTESDSRRAEAIWGDIIKREVEIIIPFSVLVEVVGAIKRRTGNQELAAEIGEKLLNQNNINFIDLTKQRAIHAMEISATLGLRGMDSLIVQISKEFNTEILTFDKELIAKLNLKEI